MNFVFFSSRTRARSAAPLILTLSAALLVPGIAADVVKNSSTDPLNTPASWIDDFFLGDITPGPDDIAVFDGNISSPFSVPLGGDVSWGGIRVTNVGGTRNQGNSVVITNPASANTITLGAGGIDMSVALQALTIQSKVAITADQFWNIANANTSGNPSGLSQNEDLTFFAASASAPVNLGGFTVTKAGAGVAAFSSGYTVSNGTFIVEPGVLHFQSGSSRTTTLTDTLSVHVNGGGILRFATQSAPAGGLAVQVDAGIKLNEGSTLALHLNQANRMVIGSEIAVAGDSKWTVFGGTNGETIFSGKLLGSAALAFQNTNTAATPGFLRMTGDNSGYSGTISLNSTSGARILELASDTAGSAAATWFIDAGNILQVSGSSVQLGTLQGTGTITGAGTGVAGTINVGAGTFDGLITDRVGASLGLTKIGPGTLHLSAANNYTGPTLVSGGRLVTTSQQTGSSSVTVAGGANLQIDQVLAGTTFNTPALTLGTASGGTLTINTGAVGNPTVPLIAADTFNVDAPSTLKVLGILSPGAAIPLIDYAGSIGGSVGFAGLSVDLPLRATGTLVNNAVSTRVDLNLTSVDYPRWSGAINGNWDIDNGTGTQGTANWREVNSGNTTRYIQTATAADSTIFDDSATGTTSVNLTTALSPALVLVENTGLTYTFSGSGKLTGSTGITKKGAGALIVKTENDHTGTTRLVAGTIELGGGDTSGTLGTGVIDNNATLVLNRGAAFELLNVLTGTGIVRKRNLADATLSVASPAFTGTFEVEEGRLIVSNPAALGSVSGSTTVKNDASLHFLTGTTVANIAEPFVLNGGGIPFENSGAFRVGATGLTFSGPFTLATDASIGVDVAGQTASISGVISGPGGLTKVGAGPLSLTGGSANTFTGLTTVAGGTLQMNKTDGINALPGSVVVEGGTLSWAQPNQLPDTADVTVNFGNMNTGNRADTIANLTINSFSPVSTFSGLTVTGTLTMTAGVHDAVNSGGTLNVNAAILSNSTAVLGANSGPSTLTIGSGGLSMTDAFIRFGNGGNAAQTAAVQLDGNFTGQGNNLFDLGTGRPISHVDLGAATRSFNVLGGTTTVEVGLIGSTPASGLTKTGDGTLLLTNASIASYSGPTVVNAGTLIVEGSINGSSSLTTNGSGTLGGSGTIAAPTIINGIHAPGGPVGTPTFTNSLTYSAGGKLQWNLLTNTDFGEGLNFDVVQVQGPSLSIAAGSLIELIFNHPNGFVSFSDSFWDSNHQWTVIDYSGNGTSAGNFNAPLLTPDSLGATLESVRPMASFSTANVGGDIVLTYAAIPEPGAGLLLLGSLVGLALRRRRANPAE